MALIGIAIHSTEENGRIKWSEETLYHVLNTVDFKKHRLGIIDNASSERMKAIIDQFAIDFENSYHETDLIIINQPTNVGTAAAHRSLMAHLKEGEGYNKLDDDVEFKSMGWIDLMEEVIRRDPSIGILGLKRKDLEQSPTSTVEHYRSVIKELPRIKGMTWMYAEYTDDIIGTCTLYNPELIKKIGAPSQVSTYSFDDYDYCQRSLLAGFKNAFLPYIEIEHLDDGSNNYTKWKQEEAGRVMEQTMQIIREYKSGQRSIYVPIK